MPKNTHTRRRPVTIALFAVLCLLLFPRERPTAAQSASSAADTQLPKFDIVSVRETHLPTLHEGFPADGYLGHGVFLSWMFTEAYDVPDSGRIIGLPTWNLAKRFDVTAKVVPAEVAALAKLTHRERRTMIRQILEERFQLKVHEEEQVRPIYILTSMAKPGPFLQQSPAEVPADGKPAPPLRYVRRSRRGQLTVERFTLTDFVDLLSSSLHTDVVDQTHLDGLYNLELDWNPNETDASSSVAAENPAADKPSIFTAVREQLGLKLTPSKGPVKVWVIDHVELPSEN